jgi:hypothetical protein
VQPIAIAAAATLPRTSAELVLIGHPADERKWWVGTMTGRNDTESPQGGTLGVSHSLRRAFSCHFAWRPGVRQPGRGRRCAARRARATVPTPAGRVLLS